MLLSALPFLNLAIFSRDEAKRTGLQSKNNLVHLLMLAVPAVGSTKDRAVILGRDLINLTTSGGGQKLFAVLLIIEMCVGKQ